MKRRTVALAALGLLAIAAISVAIVHDSRAASVRYGRALGENYFTGQQVANEGSDVFDASPDIGYRGVKQDWDTTNITADEFIAEFKKRLNSTTDYNRARSAAVILMMLGYDGASTAYNGPSAQRWQNGVSVAQQKFDDWAALIRAYDAAGRIDWKANVVINGDEDWLGANVRQGNGQLTFLPDLWTHNLTNVKNVSKKAIKFYDADNNVLVTMLKECANMTGKSEPLSALDPPAPVTYSLVPDVTFDGVTSLIPGKTYQVNLIASYPTAGTVPASQFMMRGALTTPTTAASAGAAFVGSSETGPDNIAPNGKVTRAVTISVPSNAAMGSQVCVTNTIAPADQDGNSKTSAPVCISVYGPYTASIVGEGGDIHAGSGACDADPAALNGSITGGAASSYAGYLISASGAFFDNPAGFGSYQSTSDQSGRLGQNGQYLSVCRPNIYNAAAVTMADPSKYTNITAGSATLAQLYALDIANGSGGIGRGIVRVTGGFKLLGGTTGAYPLTIYSDGDVIVSGNVRNISIGGRDAQASIAIVARNISIKATATQVDAYMFADKQIATCDDSPLSCRNTLTVNGFIMANNFLLKRAGNVNGPVANVSGEAITMNGQIYLNPPKLFEVAVGSSANVTQAQGERPVRR